MTTPGPRPPWLRPAALTLAVAVHAAVILPFAARVVAPVADGPVEIEVVEDTAPQAAPTPDALPSPEARAAEPEPEPPPPEAPPEPPPPEPVPPPLPEPAPEPPAPEPPPAPPPPEPPRPEPPARIERPPEKPSSKPSPKPRPKPRRETSTPAATASIDAAAARAARADAAAAARAAEASYAGEVSAELRARRHYPASAREAGITGTVVVAFVIGPGGRVATHTIVRSSGHAELDGAVRAMMAAVSLRPPPSGVFRSTVPIRFDLVR